MAGEVVISHSGQETGQADRLETLTLTVSGHGSHSALIDVPLSVTAVDNCPPQLVIAGHLVADVDSPVSLGRDVISAEDLDTSADRLIFYVTETPASGRLEKRSAAVNRRGRYCAQLICLYEHHGHLMTRR